MLSKQGYGSSCDPWENAFFSRLWRHCVVFAVFWKRPCQIATWKIVTFARRGSYFCDSYRFLQCIFITFKRISWGSWISRIFWRVFPKWSVSSYPTTVHTLDDPWDHVCGLRSNVALQKLPETINFLGACQKLFPVHALGELHLHMSHRTETKQRSIKSVGKC